MQLEPVYEDKNSNELKMKGNLSSFHLICAFLDYGRKRGGVSFRNVLKLYKSGGIFSIASDWLFNFVFYFFIVGGAMSIYQLIQGSDFVFKLLCCYGFTFSLVLIAFLFGGYKRLNGLLYKNNECEVLSYFDIDVNRSFLEQKQKILNFSDVVDFFIKQCTEFKGDFDSDSDLVNARRLNNLLKERLKNVQSLNCAEDEFWARRTMEDLLSRLSTSIEVLTQFKNPLSEVKGDVVGSLMLKSRMFNGVSAFEAVNTEVSRLKDCNKAEVELVDELVEKLIDFNNTKDLRLKKASQSSLLVEFSRNDMEDIANVLYSLSCVVDIQRLSRREEVETNSWWDGVVSSVKSLRFWEQRDEYLSLDKYEYITTNNFLEIYGISLNDDMEVLLPKVSALLEKLIMVVSYRNINRERASGLKYFYENLCNFKTTVDKTLIDGEYGGEYKIKYKLRGLISDFIETIWTSFEDDNVLSGFKALKIFNSESKHKQVESLAKGGCDGVEVVKAVEAVQNEDDIMNLKMEFEKQLLLNASLNDNQTNRLLALMQHKEVKNS